MDLIPTTYIDEFLTVALLQALAVISPGPDFAMVVKNSLLYTRQIGLYTAVGIAIGILFHIALAMFGIGLVLTQSPLIFTGFKILASFYLFYMAYKSIFAEGSKSTDFKDALGDTSPSPWKAFQIGVVTNVMNPKCVLFMLTLFTVVVSPATPKPILLTYGIVIFFITLIWFVFLALCFSHEKVRQVFINLTHWISRFTGLIFALIGGHILYDLALGS